MFEQLDGADASAAALSPILRLDASFPGSTHLTKPEVGLLAGVVVLTLVLITLLRKAFSLRAFSRFFAFAFLAFSAQMIFVFFNTNCYAYKAHPVDLTGRPASSITKIDKVPGLDANKLHDLYKTRGLPVVATHAIDDIISSGVWEPKQLRKAFGHLKVELQLGNVENNKAQYWEKELDDFLAHLDDTEWMTKVVATETGGKVPYFAEENTVFMESEEYQRHAAELFRRLLLSKEHKKGYIDAFLWIGPNGTSTGMHADWDCFNLLYQVHGSKTMWLYPPTEWDNLYVSNKYDQGATICEVDPFKPDYARFPKFRNAKGIEVTLNAGDVIFVPMGWFHYVRGNAPSVSVSGRAWSPCEMVALLPNVVRDSLHRMGLWRVPCTCHGSQPSLSQVGLFEDWTKGRDE